MKGPHGNGDSGLNIGQTDMGGWVRVYPAAGGGSTAARTADLPDNLPVYLSQTLANWFRQRPHFHLRCVVPICKEGTTVELHAWYDVHLLPASPLGPVAKEVRTV